MPMPRRRPDLATGIEDQVPYDQTGVMGSDMPPDAGSAPPPAAPPMAPPAPDPGGSGAPMDLGAMGQDAGGLPPDNMGADPMVGDPSGGDMGGGAPAMASPEDLQAEQMAAALEDPNIDPATRQQIEQQLSLAARRQLAGMGG